MFSIKKLSEDQITKIRLWAEQGAQMADIQKRVREDMGFPVTYMDTRLLILDLGIELKTEEVPTKPEETTHAAPTSKGLTTVTMDNIAIAGALVSGRVSFSDGERGWWKLDETGRPSLDLETTGYEPNPEDIQEFQRQLRDILEKSNLLGGTQ